MERHAKKRAGMDAMTAAATDAAQASRTGQPATAVAPPAVAGITQFASGAIRSSDRAKQRYDLISPIGLRRLAETCHEGAVKYSDFNWERGMPVHDLLNHAIAHAYMYLSGDRSEDHLAHLAWNAFAACHSEELWPHLNKGTLREQGCKAPGCKAPAPAVNRGPFTDPDADDGSDDDEPASTVEA